MTTPNAYKRTSATTRRVTNLMREFRASWYRDGWPLQRAMDTGNGQYPGDAARVNMDMEGPKRATGHDKVKRVEYSIDVWSPNQAGSLAYVDVANGTYWVRPVARITWPDVPEMSDPSKASYARYSIGYGMEDRPTDPSTGEPVNLRPFDQAAYRARYQLEDLIGRLDALGFTPLPYSATPGNL